MSRTPPTVLLDASFVDALCDAAHEHHTRAVDCYRTLLDEYESERIRLRARADVLGGRSRMLLAPVERIHIAGQHRRAARRLVGDLPVVEDAALTLVLMRREGIMRIATFDPVFDAFELTVVPAAGDHAGIDADGCNAGA